MKKFLKSPYTISILGGLIVLIVWSLISDYMSGDKLLTIFSTILTSVYGAIIAFLTFNIKVWWLLLGIACIIIITLIIANRKPQVQTKLEFTNYTHDRFRAWKWSWNWKFSDYKRGWHVSDLRAHCPKCDTPMGRTTFFSIECPRCDNHIERTPSIDKVERIIYDNINRGIKNGKD